MDIYLVGGAVRDELLGLAVKDRDWVVVGADVQTMREQGYRAVGRDFPVFLHPTTQEEYALARTERKTGHGYTGFEFHASTDVTLEEDLIRRDLTINAMAKSAEGELIDPWGGKADLDNRLLRHVSPAFGEDPLRVLRVARFAARYHKFGFTVHEDTMTLMRQMVTNGEVSHLVAERVWAETLRVLEGDHAAVYFETLRECGALNVLFPELEALYGVPQPAKWHPEIDTGVHTMMVLTQACLLTDNPVIRFAALVHDLGKATTPTDILPSHRGHEQRSLPLITELCDRLSVPNKYRDLALLVAEQHGNSHRVKDLRANTLLKLMESSDAWRRPERFEQFIVSCEADARGRLGLETQPYPQADYLRAALKKAASVHAKDVMNDNVQGPKIAEALHRKRLNELKAFKNNYVWPTP